MEPSLSRRQLAIVGLSFAYLIVSAIGAGVAIGRQLPAEWLGLLSSGGQIWEDFLLGGGTALSPPVLSMAAIALATVGSLRSDRLGRGSTLVLSILVGLNVIGALGEPITWRSISPGSFDALNASISVLMTIIPAVLAAAAFIEWRARPSDSTARSTVRGSV